MREIGLETEESKHSDVANSICSSKQNRQLDENDCEKNQGGICDKDDSRLCILNQ
jgi:hypothetical protein